MALIIDPDLLNDGATDNGSTEVFIDTSTKTIKLNTTGNLSTDGVTLKALYSFLKIQWKDDPDTLSKNLPAFPFPMVPITDESFEFVEGWDFANAGSRNLIRTGGWTVRNTSGNVTAKFAGIIGLGSIESNDQLYYYQGKANGATDDVVLTGQVNQAVQILNDPNGDGSYADGYNYTTSFTIFVREQGQIFGQASLSDIGVTTMDSIAYRFPLSTSTDLKINTVDTDIETDGSGYPATEVPYDGMSITYYATPQQPAGLTGGPYNFGIIIDADGQSAQEVYNFVQYALRQAADINVGSPPAVYGNIADPLLYYVGDTLYTRAATNPEGGGTGVFIANLAETDKNSVFFVDNTGSPRAYPYVATLTISFNPNLVNDGSAYYWIYLDNCVTATYDWGQETSEVILDASAAPMEGAIVGASVVETYDYDAATQGGRVAAGPASLPQDYVAVALGLNTGQYVNATGSIARSKSNAVALVAPLERNYANPA